MSSSAQINGVPARNYRPKNPQIRYAGIFAKLDFADYRFIEYPKFIPLEGGKHVIANSLKHELEIRAELAEKIALPADQSRHPVEAERDDLEQKLVQAQSDNRLLQERFVKQQEEHKAAMATMSDQMAQMMQQMHQQSQVLAKFMEQQNAGKPETDVGASTKVPLLNITTKSKTPE